MTKEIYLYKNLLFLKEKSSNEVNYYYLPEGDKNMWEYCTQYDFLQAKYYGKPFKGNKLLVKQKESIK